MDELAQEETNELNESSIEYARLPNESILEYTQRVRQSIIEKKLSEGIPADPKELSAVAQLLSGMDKQEIDKKRLVIEDEANKADKQAFELINSIITAVGNNNPYQAETKVVREIEADVKQLPEVELLPGEFSVDRPNMDYDSFMKAYREKNPKPTAESGV